MQREVKGSRHGPKQRDRNITAAGDGDREVKLDVGDEGGDGRVKAAEEVVEGRFHVGDDGFEESGDIGGYLRLERDNVGDGGEANVARLRLGADEAEPLFGDKNGDDEGSR